MRPAAKIGVDRSQRRGTELDWDEAPRHLEDVRCPTLIIHGAADRTLELASIKAVAAGIPGADLVLLDGLGHRPDIRRPDIVNPILTQFLGDGDAYPASTSPL